MREESLICFSAVSCCHRNVFTSPYFAISDTWALLQKKPNRLITASCILQISPQLSICWTVSVRMSPLLSSSVPPLSVSLFSPFVFSPSCSCLLPTRAQPSSRFESLLKPNQGQSSEEHANQREQDGRRCCVQFQGSPPLRDVAY